MEFIGLLGVETMFGHNSFTHPFEAPNGWMQPTETKTFNSLWVGDQHEITTTGGKNKFRKTPSQPPNVSRKKITLQNQQTIYKYLPDRPRLSQSKVSHILHRPHHCWTHYLNALLRVILEQPYSIST